MSNQARQSGGSLRLAKKRTAAFDQQVRQDLSIISGINRVPPQRRSKVFFQPEGGGGIAQDVFGHAVWRLITSKRQRFQGLAAANDAVPLPWCIVNDFASLAQAHGTM